VFAVVLDRLAGHGFHEKAKNSDTKTPKRHWLATFSGKTGVKLGADLAYCPPNRLYLRVSITGSEQREAPVFGGSASLPAGLLPRRTAFFIGVYPAVTKVIGKLAAHG